MGGCRTRVCSSCSPRRGRGRLYGLSAVLDLTTLALTTAEMPAVIAALTSRQFYKSMTSHADHRVWQDVYHAATPVRKDAYIKITMRGTAPVIQFKER